MSKYPKGKSGNPKGRPQGSKNKSTSDIRHWLNRLIEDNKSTLESDIQAMEALDRWKLIIQLVGYVLPKPEKLSLDGQIEAEYKQLKILLEEAPEEAVSAICERLQYIESNSKALDNERRE